MFSAILTFRSLALSLVALGAAACLGDTTLVTPPKQPPSTITLIFKADSEDLATATALGWAGGIPEVAVTLTPQDSTLGPPRQLQGSAAGTVTLDQLAAGQYVVDGVRWLTDAERAQLSAGDDAVGFVTRLSLNTASAAANVPTEMVASRRHGLVVSEFYAQVIEYPGDPQGYWFSDYVRLYNNTDSIIYLDGLLIGEGFAWQYDVPTFPCSLYQPFALDPLGIWARFFQQLPGRGQDYPLNPGATTVLATDAIDHRPLHTGALDLRQANFEFYDDGADVDNPDVPNALNVGTQSPFFGHGLYWNPGAETVVWLARPFDLKNMPTADVPPSGGHWGRIPANALLEVMAIESTRQYGYPECPQLVLPMFDRQPVRLLGKPFVDDTIAYRRLQLPFTINGSRVLQHTRASAWDFRVTPREPFTKP